MSEFAFAGLEPRVEPQRDGDDVAGDAVPGELADVIDDVGDDAPPAADAPPDTQALLDGLRALCAELHGDLAPALRGAQGDDARRLGARARTAWVSVIWRRGPSRCHRPQWRAGDRRGPGKAAKMAELRDNCSRLKQVADERGVEAHAFFEEGTPESVLTLARKWLGEEFVHTSPKVEP